MQEKNEREFFKKKKKKTNIAGACFARGIQWRLVRASAHTRLLGSRIHQAGVLFHRRRHRRTQQADGELNSPSRGAVP